MTLASWESTYVLCTIQISQLILISNINYIIFYLISFFNYFGEATKLANWSILVFLWAKQNLFYCPLSSKCILFQIWYRYSHLKKKVRSFLKKYIPCTLDESPLSLRNNTETYKELCLKFGKIILIIFRPITIEAWPFSVGCAENRLKKRPL